MSTVFRGIISCRSWPGDVFSKRSLQNTHIGPRQPRALYFNEDIYLGWARGSGKLEIIAHDPRLGAVFYLLERDPARKTLALSRESADCFSCHAASRIGGRPGMVVRSLFADREGKPSEILEETLPTFSRAR